MPPLQGSGLGARRVASTIGRAPCIIRFDTSVLGACRRIARPREGRIEAATRHVDRLDTKSTNGRRCRIGTRAERNIAKLSWDASATRLERLADLRSDLDLLVLAARDAGWAGVRPGAVPALIRDWACLKIARDCAVPAGLVNFGRRCAAKGLISDGSLDVSAEGFGNRPSIVQRSSARLAAA